MYARVHFKLQFTLMYSSRTSAVQTDYLNKATSDSSKRCHGYFCALAMQIILFTRINNEMFPVILKMDVKSYKLHVLSFVLQYCNIV